METLQSIISSVTENYVATLTIGRNDWQDIEKELMQKVETGVQQANNSRSQTKGVSKLTMPKYLSFGQIAEILNKCMIIRVITDSDNDETQLLGIYDNDSTMYNPKTNKPLKDTNSNIMKLDSSGKAPKNAPNIYERHFSNTYGTYSTDQNIIFKAAIAMNGNLNKHDLEELINRLMLICDKVTINKNRDLIAVGNGIFDYGTKTLMEYCDADPDKHVFLSKSVVNYNPNASLKTFPNDLWNIENWLHDISIDEEIYQLLWETMGSILRPYVKWNKTVWLYSTTGNNGKGTFCELLRNILGPKAHTSIPINDFGKDFTLGPLIGKQAIITDENDVGAYIDKIGVMKAVITGDIITINQKFKQPIIYRFQGMMIQCLNEYPRVKDKSDSFYRRQIFVPFEKCFTGKENKNIKNVYLRDHDVLEYVLYKILDGSNLPANQKLAKYYELSEPEICKEALNDYKESNDPIRQFWLEFESEFVWDLVPYKFLFDLYKSWYDKNFPRSQQVSNVAFINALKVIVQRESTMWTCDNDNKKKYRIGDKMSKTEYLIHDYNLEDWKSKSYLGRDKTKICTLTANDLSASYAGILRR